MRTTTGDGETPSTPRDVKDLRVWRETIELCKAVYQATARFPKEELYGLTAQMRRAAVAIPSNLAEGRGRGTKKDYRQFVVLARGSASELETQVIIAEELGLLAAEASRSLSDHVGQVLRMLYGLSASLSKEDGPA